MDHRRCTLLLSVSFLLMTAACTTPEVEQGRTNPPGSPAERVAGAPSPDEIAGATFRGLGDLEQEVTLSAGHWEGPPIVDGAASRPTIDLVDGPRLDGDLDGDGFDETAIILATSSGGSGTFVHLAVVGRYGERTASLAAAPVGDRVQLRQARLDGTTIVLDLVQAGEGDAMCCPGELVTRRWRLSGATLTEDAAELTGRLGPEVMAGAEWVLEAWSIGEPAPQEPEVTLTFEDGQASGSAGCNRYFTSVEAGTAPGAISVGPTGSTKMMCAPEAMEVESRFHRQLAAVDKLGFHNGRLALTYSIDDSPATMLFARR